MERYTLAATCHFGLEAVLKREIFDLGYDITHVEDGRVEFAGDEEAVTRANFSLRTAERVLIKAAQFQAESFDELFEGVKGVSWEKYIPKNGRFWVSKASSVRSELFAPSSIQSIVKKAMVDELSGVYGIKNFPEDGEEYPFRVFILKNKVTIGLDTTGVSLHKRGYRIMQGEAPIAENLAAALIMLTPWKDGRILVDPFAGSGTVAIEAAMLAANIAPGINRDFNAKKWDNIVDPALWKEIRQEALGEIKQNVLSDIQAYDVDANVLRVARENARRAGVEEYIHFQVRDVKDLSHSGKYGFVITNPPYGERLEEKARLPELYKSFGDAVKRLDSWSIYVISSYEDTEKFMGMKASKKRKIYNGMIKTDYYQFPGPKPQKKTVKHMEISGDGT